MLAALLVVYAIPIVGAAIRAALFLSLFAFCVPEGEAPHNGSRESRCDELQCLPAIHAAGQSFCYIVNQMTCHCILLSVIIPRYTLNV
jgi:hypothetical protein